MTPADPTPVPPHLSDAERALWDAFDALLVDYACAIRAAMQVGDFPNMNQKGLDADEAEARTAVCSAHSALLTARASGERDTARRLWCTRCEAHYVASPPKNWCPRCDGERLPAHSLPHPARPTPPSDAGTSEREAGKDAHAIVSAMLAAHNADPRVRVPLPIPAAPAAEGPQDEAWWLAIVDREGDMPFGVGVAPIPSLAEWHRRVAGCASRATVKRTGEEWPACDCGLSLLILAAALPGAEAGTPTLDEAAVVKLVRETIDASFVVGMNRATRRSDAKSEAQGEGGATLGRELFATVRALASEVRDRTAKAQTMWEDREGWKRTAAERGFEVARLTSEVRALTEQRDIGVHVLRRWLENSGLVQMLGYQFAYTEADDLAVWRADDCGPTTEALAVFAGNDPEAEAVAWLAAARLASPSPTGAT